MSDGQPEDETCVRVGQLTAALTTLGDALAAGDLDRMVASEAALASVAASFSTPAAPPRNPVMLREALSAARRALTRCARLGASLETFVACSLVAQGRAGDYARDGRPDYTGAAPSLIARG